MYVFLMIGRGMEPMMIIIPFELVALVHGPDLDTHGFLNVHHR